MNNTKIAVIISGEYRTFTMCRTTMAFLDDLDNDIYVSTWDVSEMKSPLLQIDITEQITTDKINKDLNRSAAIEIESLSEFKDKVNTIINIRKMAHRWERGLKLVKESGVQYDFILIVRPDMFFDNNIFRRRLNEAATEWNKEVVYCDYGPGVGGVINLNDFIILSTPEILYDIIDETLGVDYVRDCDAVGGLNWHDWWYKRITNKGYHIERIPRDVSCYTLGRPIPTTVYNWQMALKYFDMWFNSQVVQHINHQGMEVAQKNWDQHLINTALREVNSRVYKK